MTSNKPENVIPTKDNTFVPIITKDIKSVMKQDMFYTFITGPIHQQ